MSRKTFLILPILFSLACNLASTPMMESPSVESLPAETQPASITVEAPISTPMAAPANLSDYAIFSINVQDFSYPDQSAAVLNRIITLHETYNVPVDIYLTDVMAQIYAEQFPQLLERLKTSPVVAISYHYRAPRPYANNYDWLGLGNMSADELYQIVLRYETRAVDPVSGQTTDAAGGYQYVASLIGYPPYAASSLASDARVDDAVMRVFKELGAQMTVVHGRALNLGDVKKGLNVRPEHYDYMLFQNDGADPAGSFENALNEARNAQGANAPYFVGVKMHDNDFFSTQSAWLTVYVDGGKRPNWNPSLQSPLLTQAEQDAMWAMYEQTVIYAASQRERIGIVNLPTVLEMIR
ncbi:MAG: hypothetical protein HY864_04455 [Chloroflexi bacterium]|nr:hypothetical protein [Chloroflexota bacterium]